MDVRVQLSFPAAGLCILIIELDSKPLAEGVHEPTCDAR